MLDYRHEPLPKQWPGKQRPDGWRPKGGTRFKAAWTTTLALLETELRHLKARECVLHLDITNPARDLRFDGKLKSDARPSSSRVLLAFKDAGGHRHYYPCDFFAAWTQNVHAIALTLERLRLSELYEVVSGGKQYVGFRQLGAGSAAPPPPKISVEDAALTIATHSDFEARLVEAEPSVARVAMQQARKRSHPDAGGNDKLSAIVNEAAAVLEEHHGLL